MRVIESPSSPLPISPGPSLLPPKNKAVADMWRSGAVNSPCKHRLKQMVHEHTHVTQHWNFAQNRYTLINNPKVLYEDEDIFMCADMLLSNEWTMAQFHRGLLSFLFASLEG